MLCWRIKKCHGTLMNHCLTKHSLPTNYSAKTLADIAITTSKGITDMLVIVGGWDDTDVNRVYWEVDQVKEIIHLCDIPVDDLGVKWYHLCKIPQGFVITAGENRCLCKMFMPQQSHGWGYRILFSRGRPMRLSVSRVVLYLLGSFVGNRVAILYIQWW